MQMASMDISTSAPPIAANESEWEASPASLKALLGEAVVFSRDWGHSTIDSIGQLGEFNLQSKSEFAPGNQTPPPTSPLTLPFPCPLLDKKIRMVSAPYSRPL